MLRVRSSFFCARLRGLSLIEIIVSMLILAFVVAGSYASFVSTEGFLIKSRHRLEAIWFVQQKVEEYKSYAYSSLLDGSWQDTPTFSDGRGADRSWSVSTVSPPTLEGKMLDVSVSWTERGQTFLEQAVTLIADPGP
jgi:prepilin-type N-terminal cleavage/methylation domain-containing protein